MEETTLLTLNDEEIYRVFTAKIRDLKAEKLITEEEIKQIKYGIRIRFSLSKYYKYKGSQEFGMFREKPKSNIIKADKEGYVDLDAFNEELEERQGIMLNALMDYYAKDDDIFKQDLGELENEI